MSDFRKCPTCHEWNWMTNHVCPPLWYITILDEWRIRDDEEHEVYARDAESAATKFALQYDMQDGEGYFLEGEIEVKVRDSRVDTTAEYLFVITGEMVPEYNAHSKEMPDDIKQ